jgi:hypothetical protein
MARKLWCVTEPKPASTLGDCMFETTTEGFVLQVLGGLRDTDKPELHPTLQAALADVRDRLERQAGHAADLAREVDEAEARAER